MALSQLQHSKIKTLSLNSIIILILLNALYTAFFFDKSYQNVTISSQVRVNSNAKVWFVYKNKHSEKRFFSEYQSVVKDKPQKINFNIKSSIQFDYIGLFWAAPKGSTIIIDSYTCESNQDTILNAQNHKAIKYLNSGSILSTQNGKLSVSSTLSKRNWIMLKGTNIINEKRDVKHHKPIPVLYNVILLFIIVVYQLMYGNIKIIDKTIFSLTDLRVKTLRIWVFIFPFWIIISHTLMAFSTVLSLIQLRDKEKRTVSLKELKHFLPFIFIYLWIVISTFFSSTDEQFLKVIIDNLYFLLMPIAFLNINKSQLISILKWFEYGIICYFILLTVYTFKQYFLSKPEDSIFKFIETTTEIFWHTSYLSALILIVFIKKLHKTTTINWQLILFFLLSLSYMYIVNARLPFILGFAIVLFKFLNNFKTKKAQILYGFSIIITVISLLVYFLFKTTNNISTNVSNTNEILTIDARLTLWQATLEASSNNLLVGVGSENTIPVITQFIPETSNVKLRNFNAHNQFLETLLSYGLIGLVGFLYLFCLGFKRFDKQSIAFTILCASLFMVESYLQRQAGLIFFSVWLVFFINYALKKDESNIEQ